MSNWISLWDTVKSIPSSTICWIHGMLSSLKIVLWQLNPKTNKEYLIKYLFNSVNCKGLIRLQERSFLIDFSTEIRLWILSRSFVSQDRIFFVHKMVAWKLECEIVYQSRLIRTMLAWHCRHPHWNSFLLVPVNLQCKPYQRILKAYSSKSLCVNFFTFTIDCFNCDKTFERISPKIMSSNN